MSRVDSLQQAFEEKFSDRKWQECFSSPHQDERLVVIEKQVDGRNISVIMPQSNTPPWPAFRIVNPAGKSIYLFATDGCFFASDDPKRCDCLVCDDQCLCFVELKLDVTSPRQATSRLKDARNQLGATITFFKDAFSSITQNFWGFNLEAYIVMQTRLYPRQSASRVQIFVSFLEEYGVKLYEKDTKTFS